VTTLQRLYGTAKSLDFEVEIDCGYCAFIDVLAMKYSSSSSSTSSPSSPSSVDAAFARQVVLYLRQDVAVSIHL
jgi:hypothetical protein